MSGVHMTMGKKEKYEMQTRMSDLMKRVRRGAEKKVNTGKNEKENKNVYEGE